MAQLQIELSKSIGPKNSNNSPIPKSPLVYGPARPPGLDYSRPYPLDLPIYMPSALGPVPDVCAPEKKKEFLYLSLKKFSLRLTEEKQSSV